MNEKKLPEFLFAVADAEGNMLGHVSYAHGIFKTEDAEMWARGAAYEHFQQFAPEHLKDRALKVRALPVSNMIEPPAPPASINDVLVDVLYANDCCVLAIAELPLASHIWDAEVTCEPCRTTFRYTWDDDEKKLIWNWRLPKRQGREGLLVSLGEVIARIKASSENEADEAAAHDPDEGPDCG